MAACSNVFAKAIGFSIASPAARTVRLPSGWRSWFCRPIRRSCATASAWPRSSAIAAASPYLTYDQRIVNIDHGQRVFTQTFLEFSDRMAAAYRIQTGAAKIKAYAPIFARIDQQYGVPAPVIVAFWALESDFGANMGNYHSLSSIASLAYDCRRADRFHGQLLDALRLIERGDQAFEHVIAIGRSAPYDGPPPGFDDLAAIDASPVRAFDKAAEQAMIAEIEAAKKDGDTLGGVVEVVALGLPVGLGSFTSGDNRLDSQLAAAVMGIQAIKGVEIGDGFETARRRGSRAHDEMYPGPDGVVRSTNRAGGLEGGMTNGQVLRVRAAMKPISTVPRALATVDMATGDEAVAIHQRSDVCAVPAAGVVVETMVALVLARAVLQKFGGDSLTETRRNIDSYQRAVADRESPAARASGS